MNLKEKIPEVAVIAGTGIAAATLAISAFGEPKETYPDFVARKNKFQPRRPKLRRKY